MASDAGAAPLRLVVLDTETTGLEHSQGHRIIEVAAVELLGRKLSGRHFQSYLDPQRDVDAGAQQVHGLSREFLSDKPRFETIVDALLEFLGDATLVIHNAPFDIGFLDSELRRCGRPPMSALCGPVIDTLLMARDLHPGKRNSLDALCERYGVDNARRTYHGALLDTELLAEVYLAMTRGQESLVMDLEPAAPAMVPGALAGAPLRTEPLVPGPSAEELAEHLRLLGSIEKASKGQCLWLAKFPPANAS